MGTATTPSEDVLFTTSIEAADTLRTMLKTAPMMKAVRFHRPGDIRLDENEGPLCDKGQVKMRPAYVGICGSDLHKVTGGPVLIPGKGKPRCLTGSIYPATMGHELGGIIGEVGEEVTHEQGGGFVTVY